MDGPPHAISLAHGPIAPYAPDPEQAEVKVRGLVRQAEDGWIVTLFLVNAQAEPEKLRDLAWIFQPELRVAAPDGRAIFQRRAPLHVSEQGDPVTAAEAAAMAMRYRDTVEFAVGHGISVHADVSPTDPTCAERLTTVVVPTYEVPRTIAPTPAEQPALAGLVVDMKMLAEVADGGFASVLTPLVAAYRAWIDAQGTRIHAPAARLDGFPASAHEALERCREALARIASGIELLDANPQAATAFRFMNRAMWQQRVHTLLSEAVRRGQQPDLATIDIPKERSWRPFQLAFILLNLPSLTDLHHPDRSVAPTALADLRWFPTGGGKTEAYLGLTAYTLGIRRLQGVVDGRSGMDGVAVLMRYTLRLLTSSSSSAPPP
ncbi:MAG: hypothetical protein IPO81_14780 [Kouleothrix sp.]|nr:hypothetical protein [Kouleothrix sp.]